MNHPRWKLHTNETELHHALPSYATKREADEAAKAIIRSGCYPKVYVEQCMIVREHWAEKKAYDPREFHAWSDAHHSVEATRAAMDLAELSRFDAWRYLARDVPDLLAELGDGYCGDEPCPGMVYPGDYYIERRGKEYTVPCSQWEYMGPDRDAAELCLWIDTDADSTDEASAYFDTFEGGNSSDGACGYVFEPYEPMTVCEARAHLIKRMLTETFEGLRGIPA